MADNLLNQSTLTIMVQSQINPPEAPSVFRYDDYRRFLKDTYRYRKEHTVNFSFRSFLRRAGFKSSNYLKLVIDGKRNLSEASARKFGQALKLTPHETAYFVNLVCFSQAQTLEKREEHASQMLKSKVFERLQPLAQAKFKYWSRWYFVAIREMVALPAFRNDPEWIAKTLRPKIHPKQAQEAIDLLLTLDLIRVNQNGNLEQADTEIMSGDDIFHPAIVQFHRDMIRRGYEAIDHFTRSRRHLSSVTVSVDAATKDKITAMINTFRKEILAAACAPQDADEVIQVNLQVFPLTDLRGEGKA